MAVLCEFLPFFQFFLNLKSTSNSIEFSLHAYKPRDQYTNSSMIKTSKDNTTFTLVPTSWGEKIDFNQYHRIIGDISTLSSIIEYHVTISDGLESLRIASSCKRVVLLAFIWGEQHIFDGISVLPVI